MLFIKLITILHKFIQDVNFLISIFFSRKVKTCDFNLKLFEELSNKLKGFKGFSDFETKMELDGDFLIPESVKKRYFLNLFKKSILKGIDIRKIKEFERGDFLYFRFLRDEISREDVKCFLKEKVKNYIYPRGFIWRDGFEASLWFLRFSIFLSFLKDEKGEFLNFFYLLGRTIERNLSLFGSGNNHLVGELSSLFLFYISLGNLKKAKRYGLLFEKNFKKQFNRFGVSLEGVGYQIEDMEWAFLYLFFAKKSGLKVGEDFISLLRESLNFLDNYFLQKHNIVFGDSDDGNIISPPFTVYGRYKFLRFLFRDFLEYDFKAISPGSGYFTGRYGDFFIIVKSGDIGFKPFLSHAHFDNGSFILFYRGEPIFVDSGTYSYRCEKEVRNYFRGYEAHNVFILEGFKYKMRDFFGWKNLPEGEVGEIRFIGDVLEIEAIIFLKRKVILKRIFRLYGNLFQVENCAYNLKDERDSVRFYNFSKSAILSGKNGGFVVNFRNCKLKFESDSRDISLEKGFYSEKFFEKEIKYTLKVKDKVFCGKSLIDRFYFEGLNEGKE